MEIARALVSPSEIEPALVPPTELARALAAPTELARGLAAPTELARALVATRDLAQALAATQDLARSLAAPRDVAQALAAPRDLAQALALYERTVQSPARAVAFLRALHGADPRVLGEDFAGSAALSRAWVETVPGGLAYAVDLDAASLAHAPHPRVAARTLDVLAPEVAQLGPCDVVHAGNFSLGELHERAQLVAWARTARARLATGGIAVADTYGGESAWRVGALERRRVEDDGTEIRWIWEQRAADPRTARVVDALSFRVVRAGEVVLDLPDAFVYRWRLWSIPEIVDAFREVGFGRVDVRTELDDRAGMIEEDEVRSGCVALVVARA